MDRVLDPAQIEALAARSIPRLILPVHDTFARRAGRLADLADGHAIAGYLNLAAAVARAQQTACDVLQAAGPTPAELGLAQAHAMPPLPARGMHRDPQWRDVLRGLVRTVANEAGVPLPVGEVCRRLAAAGDAELEQLAEQVLEATGTHADPAAALFVSAALQVLWTSLAGSLPLGDVRLPVEPGPCPVCGTGAVASVVRSQQPYAGYRYLCCGLCATQWHRVRVECTVCSATHHVAYQSIEGAPPAIRAETCDDCHAYRKIFYQEQDAAVEPVADDLASLAQDRKLTEARCHRAGANPLYWQPAT